MGAIWGKINFDHSAISKDNAYMMDQFLGNYKLAGISEVKHQGVYLKSATQLDMDGHLPENATIYDEENNCFYNIECFLDNPDQLKESLNILKDDIVSDSKLLMLSHKKWGERFVDHIIGIFSVVIYDPKSKKCSLFTDHTGSRSLYYHLDETSLCFATLLEPILASLEKDRIVVSEKWMVACEATDSPGMMLFPGMTPYEGIYHLEAGHYIEITANVEKEIQKELIYSSSNFYASKIKYWEPQIQKKFFECGNEYRDIFLTTFNTCVLSMIPRNSEVGITLSSGLDSSSIGCVAAKILEKENRKLYSFTSVPRNGFEGDPDPYYISDETQGVLKICETYKNIIPEFVSCEEKNAFSEMKRLVKLFEYPYKTVQNMIWLDEVYEKAAKRGCRTVLTGQYGNSTISYGNILTRLYSDLLDWKFLGLYKELRNFCKKNKIPRKRVIKTMWKEILEKKVLKDTISQESMVKQELLNKYKIVEEFQNMEKKVGGNLLDTPDQRKGFLYNYQALAQLGAYETRLGLIHGIVIRDPSKDIRMIELCLNLPMTCFVENGTERGLVRNFMRGIVPDDILDIVRFRGLQGADFAKRICDDWEKIKEEVLSLLHDSNLNRYLVSEKIEEVYKSIKSGPSLEKSQEITYAMLLCSCSYFLNLHKRLDAQEEKSEILPYTV